MKFEIKKPRVVDEDQLAAALWYDLEQPGLGDDFLNECEVTVNSLAETALQYSIRFGDVRCVRLKRFKRYGIFYIVRGQQVIVLAIHHGLRHPRWLRRRRQLFD